MVAKSPETAVGFLNMLKKKKGDQEKSEREISNGIIVIVVKMFGPIGE